MILFDGKLYDSSEQNRLLDELHLVVPKTLSKSRLNYEIVVDAIDKLRLDTIAGKFDDLLADLPSDVVGTYKEQAAFLLSKEMLHNKIKTELGDTSSYATNKVGDFSSIFVDYRPLGVIFHIAAGNMDFLPAYSLVEGLLTGNINILKLPSADNGLSVTLLMQLIEYAPELKDYIYVFDTSSSDIQGMKRMAELSNAISVWGSDFAIDAVRNMAPSGVKLIEWGQKLGFCYVSNIDAVADKEEKMRDLAHHIATTKQLLCSSCQVVYLNTKSSEELRAFAAEFLPFLEEECSKETSEDIGTRARDTLVSYTNRLKGYLGNKETSDDVLRGRGCSVIVKEDSALELSPMMCNVLFKCLEEDKIIEVLYDSKNYLQTSGLICPDKDREKLTNILLASGITRVTTPLNMSAYFPGESHDGDYALRRYMRVVNIEV